MNIDLSQALVYAENDIKNRAHLKAILSDMYPEDIQDINVVLMIYESSIPQEIKDKQSIDDRVYLYYVEKIVREYGLKESLARDALNVWIDAILGRGYSDRFITGGPDAVEIKEKENSRDVISTPVQKGGLHTVDNLEYEIRDLEGNEVEITLYWGGSSNILIPGTIEGKVVAGIGEEAFMRRQSVVKAKIQEGIGYMGTGAFRNCVNLESVSFPSTMAVIGEESFRNCEALSEVHLSEGLEEIKDKAFFNCPSLTKILIPSTLSIIGDRIFSKNMLSNLTIYCKPDTYAWQAFTSMGFKVEDAEEYEIYL